MCLRHLSGGRVRSVPVKGAIILLLCLGPNPIARADPPSIETCVHRLDDAEVSELLAFVEHSISKQRVGASLWYAGWGAFNLVNVGLGAWKMTVQPRGVAQDTWLMSTIGAGVFAALSSGYIYFHNIHADGRSLALGVSLQFITTIAGAEATIWTTPHRARRDLASVREHSCREVVTPAGQSDAPVRSLSLVATPQLLGLVLHF